MTKSVQDLPALSERTLLDELNHRINNEFGSAINLVAVSALRSNNASVKAALGNVVELLHGLAEVNRALKTPDADVVVDAAEYLHSLCRSMSRSKLDRLGMKLVLVTETVWLHSERCWRLGLIVHELITNAARHALFQEGNGEVEVNLARAGGYVRCIVSDNGSAPANIKLGRGLRILGDLAESLGGYVDHSSAEGSCFSLVFPFTENERRTIRKTRRQRSVMDDLRAGA